MDEEEESLSPFPARSPLRKTRKRYKFLRKNSEQKQKVFKIAMDKNPTKPEVFEKLQTELKGLSGEEKMKLVQVADDRGNTALHYAAKAGHLQVCKLLYASGADINKRGQNIYYNLID